jgi:hypothetical protein
MGIEGIIMKIKHIIIGILLVFSLIFVGCKANNGYKNFLSGDFSITAKGSTEGIIVYFSNIPEDGAYLSVSLLNITGNDRLNAFISFHGDELEQLKNTGFLICPFVEIGHEYEITVTLLKFTGENLKTISSSATSAIANGGIYMINNPTLIWNKNDNIATLSSLPIFSEEFVNSQNFGLDFGLVFRHEETDGGVKSGESVFANTNILTYDHTQNYNSIIEMINNIGIKGDIPIFADVAFRLEYENSKWTIIFAESEKYIISI